ncbi:uncharacterized protein LOC131242712 [Magnolia sinica]|uniref:uncharacterized protein LOC131242712 n=1 Tax=Magnolia sinica TaxID=86752 RepID=UPI002658ED0B|nr:uncharacterized protein LOC131242712 [Magnolia sinica]
MSSIAGMASLSIPNHTLNLSSFRVLKTSSHQVHLPLSRIHTPSITTVDFPPTMTIRMGGGPRTYPGGVSKWQWKRMQLKKAKQLLKARLCRERQIYEMRKRAELQAAVSELERPWEIVKKAPALFSVKADEQLKVLADRFQRPGGYDLWSEKDGPQLFHSPTDGLPSARFFPKGVVHSIQPYARISENSEDASKLGPVDSFEGGRRGGRRMRRVSNSRNGGGSNGKGDGQSRRVSRVTDCELEENAEEEKTLRVSNSNSRKDNVMKGRRGSYDGPNRRVVDGRNSKRGDSLETNVNGGFYGRRDGNHSSYDRAKNGGSWQGHELEEDLYGLDLEWVSIDKEVSKKTDFVGNGKNNGSSRRFNAWKSEKLHGSDSKGSLLYKEEKQRIPFTSSCRSNVKKSDGFSVSDSDWGSID